MPRTLEPETSTLTERFERDGFAFTPPILPPDLVRRAVERMDAVIQGEYATGRAPCSRCWNPGDDPKKICKIDNAQVCDPVILELISHPEIGRWAAEATGARMVQVWSTQLLYKPLGGETAGNVGWHQDRQYWKYWDGEVFTAWLALCDIDSAIGPVTFVRGSHRWGELSGGDFFGGDLNVLRGKMTIPNGAAWEEVEGLLPAGAMSLHHRLTIHGSGPNRTQRPRRSFALHLRTEKSGRVASVPDGGYASHLDEPGYCPVIYRA